MNARRYHTDLSKIAEERHRLRQIERVREHQEEQKVKQFIVMHGKSRSKDAN